MQKSVFFVISRINKHIINIKIYVMKTIKEKTFRINKVRMGEEYWELYPKGEDKPILLRIKDVYGMLPPVWKFPWQSHELRLKYLVGKFIVYAEMDGCILFNLSEDQYSDEMKKEVERVQKIEANYVAMKEEYKASIVTQLAEYLKRVPVVLDIEDEIGNLPVCWSRYLKMYLPMQYEDDDKKQRLFLLYWLVKIANRLYKRHVDTDSSLSVTFALVDFINGNSFLPARGDFSAEVVLQQTEDDPKFKNVLSLYFEVKQELNRVLLPMPKRLEIYLIQTIIDLLVAYAQDAAELCCKRPRDFWGETINTDNEAYRHLIYAMKLPQFSSLIVEKKFTVDEIERFNSRL